MSAAAIVLGLSAVTYLTTKKPMARLAFTGSEIRIAGLPLSTVWALLLLGAAPLIVSAVAYVRDFDRFAARSIEAGERERR